MQVNNQSAQKPQLPNQPAQIKRSKDFFESFKKISESRFRVSSSGLKIAVVSPGNGQSLTAGMRVKIIYSGWLEDGTKFDSSIDKGKPFEFALGGGRVIKGWEEGLLGMTVGERRQLVIPANLAYGDRQVGKIPPGATLIFNIEAVGVATPGGNPNGTVSVRA